MKAAYSDNTEESPEEPQEKRSRDARPWQKLLVEGRRAFESYHARADNVDRMYGDPDELADEGDPEFQLFWANLEIIRPSIYARAPVPVVTPRFKDRKAKPRKAAEILERALIADIEDDDLHRTMELVRDDLAIVGRGAVWISVQEVQGMPRAIAEHVCRKDFLHDPARKWPEVDWVARRTYLTRSKAKKRFGDQAQLLEFTEREESGDDGGKNEPKRTKTAAVWELWHKSEGVVVWLNETAKEILDIRDPFLDLKGFFPCPPPAYGTLKRDCLMPIPDLLYYKDQINEVNRLTTRISALTEALRAKCFYPQGMGEVAEAVELAFQSDDDSQIAIGIKNAASLAKQSGGNLLEWLPVQEIAQAIALLRDIRAQMIEDIREITGISDIMRGDSEASETATAQNIKAQYGSIRIRNRKEEMERFCRDVIRIKAEIMAEQFDGQVLLAMSQVDDAPPRAEVERQKAILQQETAQMQQRAAQMQQAAQQNPQAAQQMQQQMAALQKRAEQLKETVSIDDVMELLQSQRLRPFVLEIETDSTIQPNEDAEKQRRTEFVAAVGGLAQQSLPMIQQFPETGSIIVEMLRFAANGFRAGREIESELDEFGDQVKEMGKQLAKQRGEPKPGQLKEQAEVELIKAQVAKTQAEAQAVAAEAQRPPEGANDNRQELQLKAREMAAKSAFEREKFETDTKLRREDMELKREMADADRKQRAQEKQADANAASGLPADYSFEQDRANTGAILESVMQMLATMREGVDANSAAIQQLAAAQAVPKRVVRDTSGEIVGVEPMEV